MMCELDTVRLTRIVEGPTRDRFIGEQGSILTVYGDGWYDVAMEGELPEIVTVFEDEIEGVGDA